MIKATTEARKLRDAGLGEYWAPGPATGTYWTTDGRPVCLDETAQRRKAIRRAEEVLAELKAGATIYYHAGAYARGVRREWTAAKDGRDWRLVNVTPFDPREDVRHTAVKIPTAAEIEAAEARRRRQPVRDWRGMVVG